MGLGGEGYLNFMGNEFGHPGQYLQLIAFCMVVTAFIDFSHDLCIVCNYRF
uniref:Uncharacterized protein n=1 Tax=Arundo donax TaxID=35708 RepID=A0A0A9G0F1_ARUDO